MTVTEGTVSAWPAEAGDKPESRIARRSRAGAQRLGGPAGGAGTAGTQTHWYATVTPSPWRWGLRQPVLASMRRCEPYLLPIPALVDPGTDEPEKHAAGDDRDRETD